MSSGDVINFMQTYQRITQQMFKDALKSSSIVMNLNSNHQIEKIKFKNYEKIILILLLIISLMEVLFLYPYPKLCCKLLTKTQY